MINNQIEYVTIASEGDSIDFGRFNCCRDIKLHHASSSTRGIIWWVDPSNVNTIEYIEIMTIGNALDFGDLINGAKRTQGISISN